MERVIKNNHFRKTQKDYSLSFKLQLVDEVEKGQLTYKQAQRKYGIQGRSTVLVWLRKHGSLDWKSKAPMKNKQPPRKKINELEAKIKRLEQEKEILNRPLILQTRCWIPILEKSTYPCRSKLSGNRGRNHQKANNNSFRILKAVLL